MNSQKIGYKDGFTDGFKNGYALATSKTILYMTNLIDEVIYDSYYDEDTQQEFISNLSTKVKQADFLSNLDSDMDNGLGEFIRVMPE